MQRELMNRRQGETEKRRKEFLADSPLFRFSGSRNAFTLIELLLVLVILTVLAALVVPQFTGRAKQAKEVAAKTDISNLENQLHIFELDNGQYPTSEQGLQALVQQPSGLKDWHGPYLNKIPVDPWGNPYVYKAPGQHNTNSFDLSSSGADGRDGTDDDVTNWQQ